MTASTTSRPHPGRLPFVVMPIVSKKRLNRVMMDGVSGFYIIYVDTLDALGRECSELRST